MLADDTIWRAGDHFPLGRAFGAVETSDETPSGATTRPFGLGYLVDPSPSAVVDLDLSTVLYDPETQMAWASEDGVRVPMSRHGGRTTKTQTQRDDKNAPDDDEDVGG